MGLLMSETTLIDVVLPATMWPQDTLVEYVYTTAVARDDDSAAELPSRPSPLTWPEHRMERA